MITNLKTPLFEGALKTKKADSVDVHTVELEEYLRNIGMNCWILLETDGVAGAAAAKPGKPRNNSYRTASAPASIGIISLGDISIISSMCDCL